MQIARNHERTAVDIGVTVTTVLDSLEGTIVDLSEGGALVVGCGLPAGCQCQIELDGHVVFGMVQWSEPDRMGIRFPYELTDGPLFEKLEMARLSAHTPLFQPGIPRFAQFPSGGFGRRSS